MGVKDLWTILSPICERKPLWEYQDNRIAIDLSCWICDSQNATSVNPSQCNMYLRNIFFRVAYLLLHGILPIFVLEGDAPELKHDTIERRKLGRLKSSQSQSDAPNHGTKKGSRRGLKAIQTQCTELLTSLGVPFVRSDGEAEALCAQLNQAKLVTGVITEDSDCFLYGARTVYRNFNLSNTAGASVDTYQMDVIEDKLKLGRNKMIALSLILGCDYDDKGVQGIGKESALKFLENCDDAKILQRLQNWRNNEFLDSAEKNKKLLSTSESLKLEVKIRQKALGNPCFPSSEIIEEFLKENRSLKNLKFAWKQPSLGKFMDIAMRKLKWEEPYIIEKFLPVLTRWHLLHGSKVKPIIELDRIVKRRKLRGIASYELLWKSFTVSTVEPEAYVSKMYEDVVKEYEELNAKGAKKKKKQTQINKNVLGDISNQTEPTRNLSQRNTKGKRNKGNAPDKCAQTLDKFLVKLNNLSLHDDGDNDKQSENLEHFGNSLGNINDDHDLEKQSENPENFGNSLANINPEIDFYEQFGDAYYYIPEEENHYRFEEENVSITNEQMIPTASITSQTKFSFSKGQSPERNIHSSEKCSLKFLADVSMQSCNFDEQNNCSLMEQGSIFYSNDHDLAIMDLSSPKNHPVSIFSSEPNVNREFVEKDFESDLYSVNSFAPKFSTPVSKSSHVDLIRSFECENAHSVKKTWISKFSQIHGANESISVSDFECDAGEISDLSDIIDCIVNKKS